MDCWSWSWELSQNEPDVIVWFPCLALSCHCFSSFLSVYSLTMMWLLAVVLLLVHVASSSWLDVRSRDVDEYTDSRYDPATSSARNSLLLNMLLNGEFLRKQHRLKNVFGIVWFNFVLETSGRVLNGELYAQRLQKLIYLHLFTDCFMKIPLHSSEQNILYIEIFMKQSVNKWR